MAFLIFFSLFLKIFNISIPNIPLSNLSSYILSWRWNRCSTSLFYLRINCLNLSSVVVEFISHWLFNSFYIFTWTWLLFLSFSSIFIKFFLSIILDKLLCFKLSCSSMYIISLKAKMYCQIISSIINFINSFIKIIWNFIRRCLWINSN